MRGFFVASVLFPPAGAVIAWKIPGLTWIARLAMTAFCGLVITHGVGLGLTIARLLARHIGGSVSLENRASEGIKASVRLFSIPSALREAGKA